MVTWKLTLAYDGTSFHGWQVQPGLPTIQGALAQVLLRITGETVLPQGSGRTDTGVHALAQVASFTLAAPIPPANLLRALNRALPPAIRILTAEPAPEGFHARHLALRKTYEYRIFPRVTARTLPPHAPDHICPPFLAPFAWDCPWPIDLALANRAAAHILGEHDFTSFAAVDPDLHHRPKPCHPSATVCHPSAQREDPLLYPSATQCHSSAQRENPLLHPNSALRTIFASAWHEENGLLIYRVTGSGFLHHMVRNLVGTFVDAASGRTPPEAIHGILAARSRSAAGPTAPARGLFLVSVAYPDPEQEPTSSARHSERSAAQPKNPCICPPSTPHSSRHSERSAAQPKNPEEPRVTPTAETPSTTTAALLPSAPETP